MKTLNKKEIDLFVQALTLAVSQQGNNKQGILTALLLNQMRIHIEAHSLLTGEQFASIVTNAIKEIEQTDMRETINSTGMLNGLPAEMREQIIKELLEEKHGSLKHADAYFREAFDKLCDELAESREKE